MIPAPDYGHLYKFKASLGIALVVSGVVFPWVVLREHSVLLVEQAQLGRLRVAARDAVVTRQDSYRFLANWWWVASLALIAVGLWVLYFSLRDWSKRQGTQDKREDAEAEKAALDVQAMTGAERQSKLDHEAEEATEATASLVGDGDGVDPVASGDSNPVGEPDTPRRRRFSEMREEVRRVEEAVLGSLGPAMASTHFERLGVRIQPNEIFPADEAPRSAIPVDLFLRARDLGDAPSWLVEVKLAHSPHSWMSQSTKALDSLLLALYRISYGRPDGGEGVAGLVVVASPPGQEVDERALSRASEAVLRRLSENPSVKAAVAFVELPIEASPDDLRNVFTPGAVSEVRPGRSVVTRRVLALPTADDADDFRT